MAMRIWRFSLNHMIESPIVDMNAALLQQPFVGNGGMGVNIPAIIDPSQYPAAQVRAIGVTAIDQGLSDALELGGLWSQPDAGAIV